MILDGAEVWLCDGVDLFLSLQQNMACTWCIQWRWNLEVHTEVGNNRACPSFGPWANLPFFHQDLLYVGTTGNDRRNSGWGYAKAVNHVAGLDHCAVFNKMGKTSVCYLTAVRQNYVFEFWTAFPKFSHCHIPQILAGRNKYYFWLKRNYNNFLLWLVILL